MAPLLARLIEAVSPIQYLTVEEAAQRQGLDIDALQDEVRDKLHDKGKVDAIVLVRERTGCALPPSKKFVDAL